MNTTPPETPTDPASGASTGDPGPQGQDPHGPHEGPRASRQEMSDLGRLRRSAHDRKIAGVAGGLARHLDIDPLVLRVAFVVLIFFGGAGLLLYAAAWLLVPEEETGEAPVRLDDRSRTVALVVVGVLAVLAVIGNSWGFFWFPWPLAIIALIVFLLLNRRDRSGPPPGPYQGPPPGYAAPPPGYVPAPGAGPGDPAAPAGTVPPTTGDDYSWQAPPPHDYRYTYSYQPPRDPRRRGPRLFWFTVALVVFALGLLGSVDVAGAGIADSAYPALAVAVIGAMLVVGAFFGRAGGLILLGLVATLAMVLTTASSTFDGEGIRETPQSAAEVEQLYEFGAGELVLDLTDVQDLEALDGRTITIEGDFGSIRVIAPVDLDVDAEAHIGGPGGIDLFGATSDGFDTRRTASWNSGAEVAGITIVAELGFGEIDVETE